MRPLLSISLFAVLTTLPFAGCGGGGGGDAPPAPPPCDADLKTCYVSPTGSNTNTGATPQDALRTISRAAQLALSDYTISVAAGTYPGEVTTTVTGKTPQNLRFLAAGQVVVDVRGLAGAAGFTMANSSGTVIDGFTILGGSDGGIVVKSTNNNANSDGMVIRNCLINASSGDGIRIQDTSHVTVFNNLVVGNAGIGVRIGGSGSRGSANAIIVNNTIYGNGARGIEIGTTHAGSPNAYVYNNIVEDNGMGQTPAVENIKVETNPRSDLGYSANRNLVFPATYIPGGNGTIRGPNDVNLDARFASPGTDFHLAAGSPAIDHGDPLDASLASLRQFLMQRSTVGGGQRDNNGVLDIGYHFVP